MNLVGIAWLLLVVILVPATGLPSFVVLLLAAAMGALLGVAGVLLGAAIITGGLYLFNQNWLHAIIYGQYFGMAYSLYLGGAALLLSDIVFNRARVTTRRVNTVFDCVGSTLVAVPC